MPKLAHPVTPAELTRTVAALVDSLVPGAKPVYADARPEAAERSTDSFAVVARRVAAEQGEPVLGWVLRELPGMYAEAEFCVLWRSPLGELLDVVARETRTRRVLFLADAVRGAAGKPVPSVRRAVVNDPVLLQYLATLDLEAELFGRGERDADTGAQSLAPADTPAYERLIAQRMPLHQQVLPLYAEWGPYSPCWCGSGQKAKWCHGVQQA